MSSYQFNNSIHLLEKFKNLSFLNNTNFNILHTQSSYLNFLEIFHKKYNFKNKNNDLYYLYNTNFQKNVNKKIDKKSFTIYQGHHFNLDAQKANLILPGLTYLEKEGLYLNMEGKLQKNNNVLKKKTNQKSDNHIFKYLSIFIQKKNIINIKKNDFSINFDNMFLYLKKKILILDINLKSKKKIKYIKKYNMFNLKKIYIENILENYFLF